MEQAYKLGASGLPLKAGDTILLCSDGLIKSSAQGKRYVEDAEIIDALQTEHESNRAAIRMVSVAEGRRPDDNVSAVTIQVLSKEKFFTLPQKQPILNIPNVLNKRWFWPALGLIMVCLVGLMLMLTFFLGDWPFQSPEQSPRSQQQQNPLPPLMATNDLSPSLQMPPTPERGIAEVQVVAVFGHTSVNQSDYIKIWKPNFCLR